MTFLQECEQLLKQEKEELTALLEKERAGTTVESTPDTSAILPISGSGEKEMPSSKSGYQQATKLNLFDIFYAHIQIQGFHLKPSVKPGIISAQRALEAQR